VNSRELTSERESQKRRGREEGGGVVTKENEIEIKR
jgi:hypothetical protein